MGIFDRMGKVIQSNLNALLDKAEDDKKLVELNLDEMDEQIKAGHKEVIAGARRREAAHEEVRRPSRRRRALGQARRARAQERRRGARPRGAQAEEARHRASSRSPTKARGRAARRRRSR